jgi:hypothetical protein
MDAAFAALRGGISFDKRQARGMNVFQVRACAVPLPHTRLACAD